MKSFKVKFPLKAVPDITVRKVCNLRKIYKSLNKHGRKLLSTYIDDRLGDLLFLTFCDFIDHIHNEFNLPESLTLDNPPAEVVCAFVQALGGEECQQ
jgi:hypothetical protein